MKISGNAIRPNMVILHNNKLFKVVKTQHVKPGKGPAYLQAEIKSIQDTTKINHRFRADENVERAVLEQKEFTFLYENQGEYFFMEQGDNYEQIQLTADEIGIELIPYLSEGMLVELEFHEEKIISVKLPATIILEVVETEAVIKGQTATSSFKPAILSNGVKTNVPQHITAGTMVVINTEDNSYVERAK